MKIYQCVHHGSEIYDLWGYDIIFPYEEIGYNITTVVASGEWSLRYDINRKLPSMMQNITALKGSSVNIIPKCPLPFEDIRKHYNVKRGYDTGDYNVFSECPGLSFLRYSDTESLMVFPDEKKVFAFRNTDFSKDKKTLDKAISFEGLDSSKGILMQTSSCLAFIDLPEAWYRLLTGTLKKPAISYRSLDLSNGNTITEQSLTDFITAVLSITDSERPYVDKEEAIILQIQALNQLDWRTCTGTMSVIYDILERKSHVFSDISYHPSRLPKSAKWFFLDEIAKASGGTPTYISDFDFYMAQSVVQKRLGLAEKVFTTKPTLERKLDEAGITFDNFSTLYNTTVRLVALDYEAEANNNNGTKQS